MPNRVRHRAAGGLRPVSPVDVHAHPELEHTWLRAHAPPPHAGLLGGGGFAPRTLGCRAGHYSASVSEPTGGGDDGASELGRPVVRDQLRTYTDLMLRSPRGVCSVVSIVSTFLSGERVQTDSRDIVLSPSSPFMVRVSVTTSRSPSNAARVTTLPRCPG